VAQSREICSISSSIGQATTMEFTERGQPNQFADLQQETLLGRGKGIKGFNIRSDCLAFSVELSIALPGRRQANAYDFSCTCDEMLA
jgi:hypothetical protein